MNLNRRGRSCPMCGGLETALHRAIDKGGTRFEIARCVKCRFVFVVNPGAETFHHLQNAPATVPEKARHRQIKRVCDHVLARQDRPGSVYRVVEVGAGWGGLAQVFSRDDRYRYVGYEPSAARAAYCRARGFDVREGLFGSTTPADVADAVIFDNVLEHVEEPASLVHAAVAALREGGLLVVIVPNLNDMRQLYRPWRERHHWQPHCHINYFATRDIDRLFGRHGLSRRYFGLEAASRSADGIGLLPRILADKAGLHVFGLNCYGVKPGAV